MSSDQGDRPRPSDGRKHERNRGRRRPLPRSACSRIRRTKRRAAARGGHDRGSQSAGAARTYANAQGKSPSRNPSMAASASAIPKLPACARTPNGRDGRANADRGDGEGGGARGNLEAVQRCKSEQGSCAKVQRVNQLQVTGDGHGRRQLGSRHLSHQPREPGAGCRRPNG